MVWLGNPCPESAVQYTDCAKHSHVAGSAVPFMSGVTGRFGEQTEGLQHPGGCCRDLLPFQPLAGGIWRPSGMVGLDQSRAISGALLSVATLIRVLL